MNSQQIIYEELLNTRYSMINFLKQNRRVFSENQKERIFSLIRWSENESKRDFDSIDPSQQDIYKILKIFSNFWADLFTEDSFSRKIKTLAFQIKELRNEIVHNEMNPVLTKEDLLFSLLCIRRFHQLLSNEDYVKILNKRILEIASEFVKQEEKNLLIANNNNYDKTNKIWLLDEVNYNNTFSNSIFIEYYQGKKLYDINIEDLQHFAWELFFEFSSYVEGSYHDELSSSDIRRTTSQLISDYVNFLKLIAKKYDFPLKNDLPEILDESLWVISEDETSEEDLFELRGRVINLSDFYLYIIESDFEKFELFTYASDVVSESILYLNSSILQFNNEEEKEEAIPIKSLEDLDKIFSSTTNNQLDVFAKRNDDLEIRPGQYYGTTYISNKSTYICIGRRKIELAKQYYQELLAT
jgi:hypothetical protein